jgi:hypothetical protein
MGERDDTVGEGVMGRGDRGVDREFETVMDLVVDDVSYVSRARSSGVSSSEIR